MGCRNYNVLFAICRAIIIDPTSNQMKNSEKRKLVIGLTGGIGSGKTEVSNRFAELGITIADADVASRTVVEPGTNAHAKIVAFFGQTITLEDQSLNRARLREIVFSDSEKLKWLESVTVPAIMSQLTLELKESTSPYAILCLSSGRGQHPLIHRNLVIDVLPETQIERAIKRDNNSTEQIKSIMAKQPTRQERLDYADDVINNDGTVINLGTKVSQLHSEYLKLSSQFANIQSPSEKRVSE